MERIKLKINGRLYTLEVKPNWTLLKVLREVLGLTGTKCGCATGDCGACKVLVDGEAVKSCTLLARKAQGKEIITIEGLSQNGELHPLQRAFIETGAVQCGFCTPGMIIAAKALLDKNPHPTREEICEALQDNLCRCTGYVKIIEAVELAAAWLRGEKVKVAREETRTGQVVGRGRPLRDAVDKVTGRTCYVADMRLPGMLYGRVLFSPVAHARIKRIDTSKAEALPGVKAVVTYKDAPRIPYNSALRFKGHDIPRDEYIFDEKVRYVGDRVAAVAADDPETAEKALRLIEVEYEELPAVFDPEEALKPEAPPVHEGGNLIRKLEATVGNVEQALAEADYVFTDRIKLPMVTHVALEPHASLAHFDTLTGKLTVWTANQNIFATRVILSEIFHLPLHKVRVIKPPVGGGFGGKLEAILEPVAALLSMKTGRPVLVEMKRKDVLVSTRTRHSAIFYLKTGMKKDGTIVGQDIVAYFNTGAYATSALNVPGAMIDKAFRLYRIPHLRVTVYPVYTNCPVAGAMRGYGSPQLMAAREIHLDKVAKKLGLDPVEFRRKNLVRPNDVNPRFGTSLGNCRVLDCLEKGVNEFEWEEKRRKPKGEGRFRRGIGVAAGNHGNGTFGVHVDMTSIALKMNEDGTLTMFTGTQDLGQGSTTALCMIVAQVLGISPEDIEVIEADTDLTPWDLGTYASRGIWVGGNAALKAAQSLRQQLLKVAASRLGAKEEEIELKEGFAYCRDNPEKKLPLKEIVIAAQLSKEGSREIKAYESFASLAGPNSYGVHFAEVEVDTETGEVKVLNYVAVHDVGRAINPLLVEGQIEGGIQMGLGYGLTEELVLDKKTGKVVNASLKGYKLFRAKDMPKIKVLLVEEGEDPGPFGAKSIGEAATVPVAPAVVNAVADALGLDFDELPVTPGRILAKIRSN
ncbi:CO or xanthine dehydrogenase, Mo-binding subunit [Thermanaeromonas toyohensis ToBE]|uniref:CO or xanthine dehydrogenase, Mo-binding subunit n=1 Tax=Thermanaeromonas toyohensis ToBE TaxID=698762 RepID=A0A1W1VF73_9FIRM|nr:molybdopterin cofactor-binding domain-containing protein [Thermanaeromonas toyohensis]SMB92059.1 CO or xanthine dehydrogenase, Mo-binding subunit [Thermanaeromonas toyohensis ToBE]